MTRSIRSLFSGPLLVGQGMGILGLGSYVFLVVSGRSLTLAQFGRLSVLWSLLFGLVGGLAFSFEQETVRSVAARGRTWDVARIAFLAGGAVLIGEALALAWATSRTGLAHEASLLFSMALGVLAMPFAGIMRGILVGAGRYGGAGAELAAEGLLRGALVLVLALAGASAGAYGLLLAGAPLVAALLVAPTALRGRSGSGRPRPWPMLIKEVGTLILGSGLALVVLNLGPLLATRSGGAEAAARFTPIFTLARLPVFFSGPVAAALLPRFVEASVLGRLIDTVRSVGRSLGVGLVLAGLALAAVAPTLVGFLYGHRYESSYALSLLLVASGIAHLLAMIAQAALIASDTRRSVVLGWLIGLAILLGSAFLSHPSLIWVGVAYLVSGVSTLVFLTASLVRAK